MEPTDIDAPIDFESPDYLAYLEFESTHDDGLAAAEAAWSRGREFDEEAQADLALHEELWPNGYGRA